MWIAKLLSDPPTVIKPDPPISPTQAPPVTPVWLMMLTLPPSVRSARMLALLLDWRYRSVPSASVTFGKYTTPPTPAVVPRSATNAAMPPVVEKFSAPVIVLTSGRPVATSFTIPPMAAPFWSVRLGRPKLVARSYVPPATAPSNSIIPNW